MMTTLRQLWRRVESISPWWRMLLLLGAFTFVIALMIWQQQRLLRTGREVIVPMRPVDPRDLFRGHYARLNYDFSRIRMNEIRGLENIGEDAIPKLPLMGGIYIVLKKDPHNPPFWRFSHAQLKPPRQLGEDEVFLACDIAGLGYESVGVRCGIERFYAPRERALALERELRGRWRFDSERGRMMPAPGVRPPGVILRVNEAGKAAIAGLQVDGRRIMVDSLF